MSLELPRYVAYSVPDDGIYIYYLESKKLKVHIYLAGQALFYVYPTTIISFTDSVITFINQENRFCVYDWRNNVMISIDTLFDNPYKRCQWAQPLTSDGYYVTNALPERIIGGYYKVDDIVYAFEIPSGMSVDRHMALIETVFQNKDHNCSFSTGYYYSRWKDTRGYKYYMSPSPEFFVEIRYQDRAIWADTTVRSTMASEARIETVAVLDALEEDLREFDLMFYGLIKDRIYIRPLVKMIREYL